MKAGLLLPIFLLVPLSGCATGPDGARASLDVGDAATYEGADGSLIEVEAVALAVRRDGLLRPHESVVLAWSYVPHGAGSSTAFRFEEAVAVRTGLVVQQVAHCGSLDFAEGGGLECYDGRAVLVTSSGGLPGGFGAGPSWAAGSASSEALLRPVDELVGLDQLAYDVERDVGRVGGLDGCRAFSTPAPATVRALPWTVVGQSFTLCDGSPWPAAFAARVSPMMTALTGAKGPTVEYTLSAHREGEGTVPWGTGDDGFAAPSQAVQPKPLGSPAYTDGFAAGLSFPVQEAHAEALARVPAYRQVMESGGILELYHHHRDSSATLIMGGVRSNGSEVLLVATSPSGEQVRVRLGKSVSDVLGVDTHEYDVRSVRNARADPPSTSPMGVDPLDAMALAARLGGGLSNSFEDIGFGHERSFNSTTGWTYVPALPKRMSGYEVYIGFDDPAQSGAGLAVYFPYYALVDGTTGALLHLSARPKALPF